MTSITRVRPMVAKAAPAKAAPAAPIAQAAAPAAKAPVVKAQVQPAVQEKKGFFSVFKERWAKTTVAISTSVGIGAGFVGGQLIAATMMGATNPIGLAISTLAGALGGGLLSAAVVKVIDHFKH